MHDDYLDTEPGPTPEQEFQQQWDIAFEKLGVAEKLAWPLAMGWGSAVGLMANHWLLGILVFGGAYYISRYPYAKECKKFEKLHKQRTFGVK